MQGDKANGKEIEWFWWKKEQERG